jgi:hypothetical protein
MRDYHTVGRIVETWHRAEAAGINTMVTNNETPHVVQALREYLAGGGRLQWVAQLNIRIKHDMIAAIDEAVAIGCKAIYFHGGLMDDVCRQQGEASVRAWHAHAKKAGVPVGSAGHDPRTHLWLDGLDILDFHAVPFFNCGSVHDGAGEVFRLGDMQLAIDVIRKLRKPCLAYKIMGAGRIDAKMAFEHAFASIKPTDIVNVGMHRGDNDNLVEENVAMVREILSERA